MTKLKDTIIIYLILLVEILILSNSKLIINNVINSSYIFMYNIFPSMFPTTIIGLMLTKLNYYKIRFPKQVL